MIAAVLTLTLALASAPPLSPEGRAALESFVIAEAPIPPAAFTVGITRRFGSLALTYRIVGYSSSTAAKARSAVGVLAAIMGGGSNPAALTLMEVSASSPADFSFEHGSSCTLGGVTKTITKGAMVCWTNDPVNTGLLLSGRVILYPGSTAQGLLLHELVGHLFGVLIHRSTPAGNLWAKSGWKYTAGLSPAANVAAHPEWEPVPGAYEAMRWIYHNPAGTAPPLPAY